MPRKNYTEYIRPHLVALVLEGRTPEQLAREYEPAAKTIRDWVRDAKASELPEEDKDKRLRELEAENARLREERDILKKAAVNSNRQRNTSMNASLGVL